jgi:hypothetical protein
MKAKVFPIKQNKDDVFLVLEQEDDSAVLLMLADSQGMAIEGTEILRISEEKIGSGKLRLCRIVGRQSIKAVTSKFEMDGSAVKVI